MASRNAQEKSGSSIVLGVGRHLGSQSRANTSMTIMRAPQRGHGQGRTRGASGVPSGCCCGSAAGGVTSNSARVRRDVLGAVSVGKEPVVADAVKTLGQHVQQEAPDELVRMKPHRLPAAGAVDAIVLPAERNAGVVGCNEAAVRNGDTMSVT